MWSAHLENPDQYNQDLQKQIYPTTVGRIQLQVRRANGSEAYLSTADSSQQQAPEPPQPACWDFWVGNAPKSIPYFKEGHSENQEISSREIRNKPEIKYSRIHKQLFETDLYCVLSKTYIFVGLCVV